LGRLKDIIDKSQPADYKKELRPWTKPSSKRELFKQDLSHQLRPWSKPPTKKEAIKTLKEGILSTAKGLEGLRRGVGGDPIGLVQGLFRTGIGGGKLLTSALEGVRRGVEVPWSIGIYKRLDALQRSGVELGTRDTEAMSTIVRKLYPTELKDSPIDEVWKVVKEKTLSGELDPDRIFMYSHLSEKEQRYSIEHSEIMKYPIVIGASAMSLVTSPWLAITAGLKVGAKINNVPLSSFGKKKLAEFSVAELQKTQGLKSSMAKKFVDSVAKDFRKVPEIARSKAIERMTKEMIKHPEIADQYLDSSVLRLYGIPILKKGQVKNFWSGLVKAIKVNKLTSTQKTVIKRSFDWAKEEIVKTKQMPIPPKQAIDSRIRYLVKATEKAKIKEGSLSSEVMDLFSRRVKSVGKEQFLAREFKKIGVDPSSISPEAKTLLEQKMLAQFGASRLRPYQRSLIRKEVIGVRKELLSGKISSTAKEFIEKEFINPETFLDRIDVKGLSALDAAQVKKQVILKMAGEEILIEAKKLGIGIPPEQAAKLVGEKALAEMLYRKVPVQYRSLIKSLHADKGLVLGNKGRQVSGTVHLPSAKIKVGRAQDVEGVDTLFHELAHIIENKYPLSHRETEALSKSILLKHVGSPSEVFAHISASILGKDPASKNFVKKYSTPIINKIIKKRLSLASKHGYSELTKQLTEEGIVPLALSREVTLKPKLEPLIKAAQEELINTAKGQFGDIGLPGLAKNWKEAFSELAGVRGEPDRLVLRFMTKKGIQRAVTIEKPFLAEGRAYKWIAKEKWAQESISIPTRLGSTIEAIKKGLGEAFVYDFGVPPQVGAIGEKVRAFKQRAISKELSLVDDFVRLYPLEGDRVKIAQYINDLRGVRTAKLKVAPVIEERLKKGVEFFSKIMDDIANYEKQIGLTTTIPSQEYLTHLYKNNPKVTNELLSKYWRRLFGFKARSRFWKERTFETWQEAEEIGLEPIKDAAKLLGVRMHYHNLLKAKVQFLDKIKGLPRSEIINIADIKDIKSIPKEFARLDKIAPQFNQYMGSPGLAKYLKQWVDVEKKVAYPIYVYDRMTNGLKHVLFYNPVFFGGNVVVNTLKAGGNPLQALNYIKEIKGKGPLYNEALNVGLFSDAMTKRRDLVSHMINNAVRNAEIKKGVWPGLKHVLKHPAKTVRDAHQTFLWDYLYKGSCLSLYEKGKSWGMGPKEAANFTHKFLGNFNQLSAFEREVGQRIFFVYPWWRKNLPLQMKLWLTAPGKQVAFWKVYDTINQLTVGHRMSENPVTKRTHMATPWLDKKGNRLYIKPVLPDKDPVDFINDLGGFFSRRLNPLMIEGIQQLFNRDLFTGKKISRYGIPEDIMGAKVPARAAHAARQIFWPMKTLEASVRGGSPQEILLREGTGSSVSRSSPYGEAFDLRRMIKEYRSEMGKAHREGKASHLRRLIEALPEALED